MIILQQTRSRFWEIILLLRDGFSFLLKTYDLHWPHRSWKKFPKIILDFCYFLAIYRRDSWKLIDGCLLLNESWSTTFQKRRQAVTKDLTSSSKFSGSSVLTLQTQQLIGITTAHPEGKEMLRDNCWQESYKSKSKKTGN